ncbi:patatin-like phospholipase family protein [Mesorhizobium sp.]|uniref:patatin-like phospholipase family protein n=1 Tax=Mesorhizobium sp. TaxID=1871066 RepID=UPI00257A6420|nr:patatin-like phospholipase family protein [Mesorhizobium sp.]
MGTAALAGKRADTWEKKIRPALSASAAFDEGFFKDHGERLWTPNDQDRSAAILLHIELVSRVATQRLDYSHGVEEGALKSIFELFGRTRTFCTENPGCSTFEIVAWHVLNATVRPFTARWHPIGQAGGLRALDTSDEFRGELETVQSALLDLDAVLQVIAAYRGYSPTQARRVVQTAVDEEMQSFPGWRPMGRIDKADLLSTRERDMILARRQHYDLDQKQGWASGLALSGGGIRSATFAIGVLAALARRNLLPQFDYISSVSGGGYAAGFLTQLLAGKDEDPNFGLEAHKQPFVRDEGESRILRKVRNGASYLSGSFVERTALAAIQAHGMFMNLLVVTLLTAVFAYVEFAVRHATPWTTTDAFSLFLPVVAIGGLVITRLARKTFYHEDKPSYLMTFFGGLFLLLPTMFVLHFFHAGVRFLANFVLGVQTSPAAPITLIAILAWLALTISGFVAVGAIVSQFNRLRPALLTTISAIFLLVAQSLFYNFFADIGPAAATVWAAAAIVTLLILWLVIDINVASLHHYYRFKLSKAFLLKPSCDPAEPMNLSTFDARRALFPIINCALNVPSSSDPVMRGRLSDVFAITPVAAGARVLGYFETDSWEVSNTNLDLGSTIALSGAAVSPQMGLRTKRYASFWLTVLNLRLGIWLRRPGKSPAAPGLWYLLKEMTATADERGAFLNISDGGHIENLGVYELMKRRCRFIVAIDGENDPTMTFHALTNLQRLAYIDFGITLDVNLDDLRLGEAGYSRSHFQLCRILYPQGPDDSPLEVGYLLYMKLSLTGNEGEYLKRFKLDEPTFPHHSTADQFFSETQFEAYRSLGEHIGEKMFLPAITGPLDQTNVQLEEWFRCLGHSMLRPVSTGERAPQTAR